MALVDLKLYYLKVQEQYFEMLSDSKDFDEALKGGYVTEEQVAQANSMLGRVKENYDRLSYIMLLLNKPKRRNRVNPFILSKENKALVNYCRNNYSTKDLVIDENTNVLQQFKQFVKEYKNE